MLGEAQQLVGLGRVVGDLAERGGAVALREARNRLSGVGDPGAQALRIPSHAGDDLRGAPRALDRFGEGVGAVIQQLVGPRAQLHDARIARAQLLRGVRDLVVVQLVQVEGFGEMRAHRVEGVSQITRGPFAQLRHGEGELVGGDADALVHLDQSPLRIPREVDVLGVKFFAFALASAPESGHDSILRARRMPSMRVR